MRKYSLILFLVIGIYNLSYSQEKVEENDFLDGKVLLFHLSGLSDLNLESINGGRGISYKISDNIYHRNIINMNSHKGYMDNSYKSSENMFYSLFLKSDFINILKMRGTFRPYWGYGFQLGYSRSKFTDSDSGGSSSVQSSSAYSMGVDGLLGIEYFVKDNISITAEYIALLNYNFNDSNAGSNKLNWKNINYNQDSFGLIIAFYL